MLAGLGAGLLLAGAYALTRPRYSFRDKVVVITGGSRGLGLVIARQLAREGAALALLARDGDELDQAVDELGSRTRAIGVICDVTDQQAVDVAIDLVLSRFGGIDVLINNAGMIQVGPLDHMTVEDFDEAMKVHFYGSLYTSLAVLESMRRQGGGRIINITSIGGKVAAPHLAPYVASKFALVGLSEAMQIELAKQGVVVTTVCPGLMRTGSPPNALIKGRRRAEYAWFAISDAMPGLSMSAERAAAKIIEASRRGRARVVLSLPAKLAVAMHELCPQTYARFASTANRLLPGPTADRSPRQFTGRQSRSTLAPSLLTALSDRASLRNNEGVVH